jgi:hypothetical protein
VSIELFFPWAGSEAMDSGVICRWHQRWGLWQQGASVDKVYA